MPQEKRLARSWLGIYMCASRPRRGRTSRRLFVSLPRFSIAGIWVRNFDNALRPEGKRCSVAWLAENFIVIRCGI